MRIEALVQIAAQHLDRGARLREADGLHAPANQPLGDPLAGEQRRRSNPELLVGDGWVQDQDVLPPSGSAVVVDQLDRCLEKPLRQIPRVGDGGAGTDEDGIRAVMAADASQPSHHVGHVAAEQPAVGVELVDDDEAQVLEKLEPLRVVRKDRGVEHVRVGDDHLPRTADHAAHVGRCVAVVGVRLETDVGRIGEGPQLNQLVRGQGLGGKDVERPSCVVTGDGVEDRQVVAEGLP